MARITKLAIVEVKPEESGDRKPPKTGQWHKVAFKANDGTGGHWYACFTPTLFEHLKVNTTIEASVETKEDERGVNRTVTSIFIDGKSVGGQKPWQPRGESYSSEKQAGIERMAALKSACEIQVPGFTDTMQILAIADKFYTWLQNGKTAPMSPRPGKDTVQVISQSPVTTLPPPIGTLTTTQPDKDWVNLKGATVMPDPTSVQAFNVWLNKLGLPWNVVQAQIGLLYGKATENPAAIASTVVDIKAKFPEKFKAE